MSVLRSASVFASWTLVSRLLGFARDILLATLLGASALADVFLFAYRFPHLFRALLAEGAMMSSFVPLYQKVRHKSQTHEGEAQAFSGRIFLVLFSLSALLCLVMLVFMPEIVSVLAVGFEAVSEKFTRAVSLSRISILYLPLITAAAFLCAILTAHGFFALYGALPLVLNGALLCVLVPFVWFGGFFPSHRLPYFLLYALLAAGLLQCVLSFVSCARIEALPRPLAPARSREFWILFASALCGHGLLQINFLVNQYFASKMEHGTIAALYYAERLLHLPVGVIGVALASALLPEISRLRAQNDQCAMQEMQERVFSIVLVFAVPSAAGLLLLSESIFYALFQYGAFDVEARVRSARLLSVLALALPAFALNRPLLSVMFAFQRARTILGLSLCAVAVNFCLAWILTPRYGYLGIAYAVVASAWSSALLNAAVLVGSGYWRVSRRFVWRGAKILIATGGLVGGVIVMRSMFIDVLSEDRGVVVRLASLAAMILVPAIVYGLGLLALRLFSRGEWREMRGS